MRDRLTRSDLPLAVWDLAFFGRQDRVSHLSTEIPLTPERIEWWQNRFKSVIHRVNETWPGVPIWLRKLHRVGPVGGASCTLPSCSNQLSALRSSLTVLYTLADDWRHTGAADGAPPEKFSNFFTNVRIHQIREMQSQVAKDAGLPAFDFGEVWEGWQPFQQMVHPEKVRTAHPGDGFA